MASASFLGFSIRADEASKEKRKTSGVLNSDDEINLTKQLGFIDDSSGVIKPAEGISFSEIGAFLNWVADGKQGVFPPLAKRFLCTRLANMKKANRLPNATEQFKHGLISQLEEFVKDCSSVEVIPAMNPSSAPKTQATTVSVGGLTRQDLNAALKSLDMRFTGLRAEQQALKKDLLAQIRQVSDKVVTLETKYKQPVQPTIAVKPTMEQTQPTIAVKQQPGTKTDTAQSTPPKSSGWGSALMGTFTRRKSPFTRPPNSTQRNKTKLPSNSEKSFMFQNPIVSSGTSTGPITFPPQKSQPPTESRLPSSSWFGSWGSKKKTPITTSVTPSNATRRNLSQKQSEVEMATLPTTSKAPIVPRVSTAAPESLTPIIPVAPAGASAPKRSRVPPVSEQSPVSEQEVNQLMQGLKDKIATYKTMISEEDNESEDNESNMNNLQKRLETKIDELDDTIRKGTDQLIKLGSFKTQKLGTEISALIETAKQQRADVVEMLEKLKAKKQVNAAKKPRRMTRKSRSRK